VALRVRVTLGVLVVDCVGDLDPLSVLVALGVSRALGDSVCEALPELDAVDDTDADGDCERVGLDDLDWVRDGVCVIVRVRDCVWLRVLEVDCERLCDWLRVDGCEPDNAWLRVSVLLGDELL